MVVRDDYDCSGLGDADGGGDAAAYGDIGDVGGCKWCDSSVAG